MTRRRSRLVFGTTIAVAALVVAGCSSPRTAPKTSHADRAKHVVNADRDRVDAVRGGLDADAEHPRGGDIPTRHFTAEQLRQFLAGYPRKAPPAGPIRLGFCGGDDWEPDIAASGTYIYVVWAHFAGDPACDPASGLENRRVFIQVSSDSGTTWGAPHVVAETPGGRNYANQVDSTVAVSDTGTVYVGMLAYGLQGNHTDVAVSVSTDHGATFASHIVNGPGCTNCDHPFGVARGQNVYFTYSQGKSHYLSRSANGGSTWSESLLQTFDVVAFTEGGVVDAQGNAWFAWGDCQSSNCTGAPAYDYRVSETLAGTGTTAFSPVIGQSPQGPDCAYQSCGFAYWGGQDDIGIDAGGTLYLAWQDGQSHGTRKSPPIVQLSKCSTNCTAGGWTYVGRADDKNASNCAGGTCYALYPRVEGGAAGRVTVMWMDDRNDSIDGLVDHVDGWNVWTRTSTTGGATWTGPGVKLSAYDPSRVESTPNGFLFPYGDYEDLRPNPSCAGGYVFTWGEGRNYDGGPSAPGHILERTGC